MGYLVTYTCATFANLLFLCRILESCSNIGAEPLFGLVNRMTFGSLFGGGVGNAPSSFAANTSMSFATLSWVIFA